MAFDHAKEQERRIARKIERCIHFTGIQHKVCEAGVSYESLRSTPPTSLPCLPAQAGPTTAAGFCEKFRATTREEAEAEVRDADEAYQRINACLVAIRKKHGKARGLRDTMPCPTGCGGTLHYSIASYNGHVHGQCSTSGCAQWMQ